MKLQIYIERHFGTVSTSHTASFHSFAARIDFVVNGSHIELHPRDLFKNGYVQESAALHGAKITWGSPVTWRSPEIMSCLELVCKDETSMPAARLKMKKMNFKDVGSMKVLVRDLLEGAWLLTSS